MYLAYFDESGDAGLVNSLTRFFVLSCALVHEKRWLETLDGLVKMRAKMREQHGISPRPEIKIVRHSAWSRRPKPEMLKLEGPWEEAVAKALKKKRPEGGWPKPEPKKKGRGK
jgi:hypothetical protein